VAVADSFFLLFKFQFIGSLVVAAFISLVVLAAGYASIHNDRKHTDINAVAVRDSTCNESGSNCVSFVTYTVVGEDPHGTATNPIRVDTHDDRFKIDDKLEVRYNNANTDKAIYGERGSGWTLLIGGSVVFVGCIFAIYIIAKRV
jgi:hypothetical protein